MQENKGKDTQTPQPPDTTENQMAQNPNPRANENIKNTTFDKADKTDDTTDVGSEITDGTGG